MLYDAVRHHMMLYDVIAVDFIAELCVFQLNAKLKPSYIPLCGIFVVLLTIKEFLGLKGSSFPKFSFEISEFWS